MPKNHDTTLRTAERMASTSVVIDLAGGFYSAGSRLKVSHCLPASLQRL